jgi:hypothetical protein
MGFLGSQVGSYVVKNIYGCLIFLSNVEQCTTFEGEEKQLGVGIKEFYCPNFIFLYL